MANEPEPDGDAPDVESALERIALKRLELDAAGTLPMPERPRQPR